MGNLIPRPNYPPYSATGLDEGREEVDAVLLDMERRIHSEYEQAAREMQRKADDYFFDFIEEDQKRRKMLSDGEITQAEYNQWRISHMATGRRYYEMASVLASDMTHTNEIAAGIVNGYMPDIFAIGYNYSLYQGEMTGDFQTSFTLYNRDAVIRLMRDNPDLLPIEAKVNVPEDERWNMRQISSSITQSIMQGERIDKVAERLARTVTGMNERVAMRNARTATTSAENGGRYEGFRNLTSAGVDMVVEWCATLDGRTRHEHRLLDGQRQNVDEPFEVDGMKILYAGDPRAPQGLIWNCRCTMLSWVKGFEPSLTLKAQSHPDNMSYAEWKFEKQEETERRRERAEARRNRPPVNPDNPSYGSATQEDRENAAAALNNHTAFGVEAEKPVRPSRFDFESTEEYKAAKEKFNEDREKYKNEREAAVQNMLQRDTEFKSAEDVKTWAERVGIKLDESVLEHVDVRAFEDIAYVIEDEFKKHPFLRSGEYTFDGNQYTRVFEIRFEDTSEFLMDASNGLRLSRQFTDYGEALRDMYDSIASGYTVRGDGTPISMIRHEIGHNIQERIAEKLTTEDRVRMTAELREISAKRLDGSSEYSTFNDYEMFAEGYAAVSSGQTTDFSSEFSDFMERWLKHADLV